MLADLDEMLIDTVGEDASIHTFYESDDLGISTEGPDERVELMDEWGLQTAVLSVPSPESFVDPEYLMRPEVLGQWCEIVNDHLAAAHEAHPDRLFGFASVPLIDADRSVAELDRAIDDLGLQGVVLDTNVFGRSLIDEEFRPFFEAADKRSTPLFLHPTNPPGKEDRLTRFYTESMIGFPMDTTLAATEMIFSGFLEEYDDLEIILSHLGGALPYLRRRLEFLYSPNDPEFSRNIITEIPKEPPEYLEEFWYDTAMTYPRAIELARDIIGDRLIFGSDYPFGPEQSVEETEAQLDELDLPSSVSQEIHEENARDILLNV
jgi:aminocarboxymuconate-semialdehyde decarboxylase